MDNRFAISPTEARQMDTASLRNAFLIERVFVPGEITLTLTHYDRYISGGVMPLDKEIPLPNPDKLKAKYFLERRELGVINVGGKGIVSVDGEKIDLDFKEALY